MGELSFKEAIEACLDLREDLLVVDFLESLLELFDTSESLTAAVSWSSEVLDTTFGVVEDLLSSFSAVVTVAGVSSCCVVESPSWADSITLLMNEVTEPCSN